MADRVTGSRKIDGTFGRITRVVTGSKRSAREAMAEMEIGLSKRPADALRLAQGMTVGQLLPRWLARATTRWTLLRERVPGAETVRRHDLRRWQATVLLDAGVPHRASLRASASRSHHDRADLRAPHPTSRHSLPPDVHDLPPSVATNVSRRTARLRGRTAEATRRDRERV